MSKFFRVYAILYSSYLDRLESLHALGHLNTSFKQFMFFTFAHKCVDIKEFDAIRNIVDDIKKKYDLLASSADGSSGGGGGG